MGKNSFSTNGKYWNFSTPEDAKICQEVLNDVVEDSLNFRMAQIRQELMNFEQKYFPDEETLKRYTNEAPPDHRIFGILDTINHFYKILDKYEIKDN
jgi:hypothetical protein